MTDQLPMNKLELVHHVSNLVDKSGLWTEIARLGMTREFIEHRENFYARILMELDFIEHHSQDAAPEVKRLRSQAVLLSRNEQHLNSPPSLSHVA